MFALLAALCFLAELLGAHLGGGIDLVVLGLFFLALQLLLGVSPTFWRR